jgi:cysteate synthase
MWSIEPRGDTVKVIVADGDCDYADAIALGQIISSLDGFVPEGGAKNVARRDGMGTTVLSAVEFIGEIPHHYFQAVGSGTGAIAAWEANLRYLASGEYGDRRMKLHVSQNAPFQLIHDSWRAGGRSLAPIEEEVARRQIAAINAKVLANRHPPYSVKGGLYDALTDSGGTTAAVTNKAADAAAELFRSAEGIDLEPAAAIAVADLIQSVESGTLPKNEIIMLNVTGGGIDLIMDELNPVLATPDRMIPRGGFCKETVSRMVRDLF